MLEEGVSRGETGEPGTPTLGRQSIQSAVESFPPTMKFPKPPPPICPIVSGSSPSPDKSRGAVKGSPSRGSPSREGDWHTNRTQPWDWQSRRWR